MKCPKCGRSAEEDAVICRGCDYILDVSFLFAEATDEWVAEEHAQGFEAERTQEVPDFLAPAGTDASLAAAFQEGLELWSVGTSEFLLPDAGALSPFDGPPQPGAQPATGPAVAPPSGTAASGTALSGAALTDAIVHLPPARPHPSPSLVHTIETLPIGSIDLLSSEQGTAPTTSMPAGGDAPSAMEPATSDRSTAPIAPLLEVTAEDRAPEPGRFEPEMLGADPVVLGDVSEDFDVFVARDTNWFLTAATQMVPRLVAAVPVYVSRSVRDMLQDDAVLARVDGCTAELSHFESHVLQYVDGSRPVARIAKKCGLARQDLDIAISMLAEKHAISLIGRVQRPEGASHDAGAPSAGGGPQSPGAAAPSAGASSPVALRPPPSPSSAPAPERPAAPPSMPASAAVPAAPPAPTPTQVTRTLVMPLAGVGPGVPGVPGVPGTLPRRGAVPSEARAAAPAPGRSTRPRLDVRDLPSPASPARPASPAPPAPPALGPLGTEPLRAEAGVMAPGVPPEIEWLRLSQQKEAEGDFRAAVELLRRCVAKKPEVAAFHNRLGVLLAARLKDFGAAVPHLTRAVELQPGNETFRSNFGKIVAAAAAQPSAEKDAGAEGQGLWARLRRLL